jgi:hypothetical protein
VATGSDKHHLSDKTRTVVILLITLTYFVGAYMGGHISYRMCGVSPLLSQYAFVACNFAEGFLLMGKFLTTDHQGGSEQLMIEFIENSNCL